MGLIERLAIPKTAAVIDIGGRTSVLADELVERGFRDLSVLDVSKTALVQLQQRLSARTSVSLLHQDLLAWKPERTHDLWHDRAMFHFLVDRIDREIYLRTLRWAVRTGGVAITFISRLLDLELTP